MRKAIPSFVIASVLVVFVTVGCISASDAPSHATSILPTFISTLPPSSTTQAVLTSIQVATDTGTPSPTPALLDTGWVELQPGLERRIINYFDDENTHVEQIYALQLNPEYFTFDIAYHPGTKTLEAWQLETNALVVFNGGFFRIENETSIPNGLTILNGQAMGTSYGSFAGMFVVTHEGPELRWLADEPYDADETLVAAFQSFPLLVKPGGELGFSEENEDNLQARRSVIGQTKNGDLLFIITSKGYFTLHQLSVYLVESDFDLDIAINLDGGPSSGMLLSTPYEFVPSYIPLPIVITVHRR
jgi:uncharacterized protein YigE (DUF2233 family)